MNFDIKKQKWLIPALCVLIILEAVIIVNRLELRPEVSLPISQRVEEQFSANLSIQGDDYLLAGESGKISVVLTALEEMNLDGVDIYLNYDPQKVEVIGTAPGPEFSYVARNWVEPEENKILISLIEPEIPTGVYFPAGSQTNLAEIEFFVLEPGQTKFEFYKPDDTRGTVLAGQGGISVDYSKQDFILEID